MSKIYVPTEYLGKPCYTINNGYIRVYDTINYNSSNKVYDIYINQDYMVKSSTSSYSNSTQCVDYNLITDEIYYRTDFADILLIFSILILFGFGFGISLFRRLFRRLL